MALIIPFAHTIHRKPPKYACTLCEAVFTEDERFQYERHCLRGHDHAELREHSLAVQAPGLFDENWEGADIEWKRWIDRNNETRPDEWMKWMKTSE